VATSAVKKSVTRFHHLVGPLVARVVGPQHGADVVAIPSASNSSRIAAASTSMSSDGNRSVSSPERLEDPFAEVRRERRPAHVLAFSRQGDNQTP
jgi:hypothetical protein